MEDHRFPHVRFRQIVQVLQVLGVLQVLPASWMIRIHFGASSESLVRKWCSRNPTFAMSAGGFVIASRSCRTEASPMGGREPESAWPCDPANHGDSKCGRPLGLSSACLVQRPRKALPWERMRDILFILLFVQYRKMSEWCVAARHDPVWSLPSTWS